MTSTDRDFSRVIRQTSPAPLWARIVGGAFAVGGLALAATLIAWPIWAIWTSILS